MYSCGYAWHRDPCMNITLQDLEIVSDGPGALGVMSLEGWSGGTAASGGPVAWESADGGVHGDVFFGPRTVTIEGDIEARDHREFADLVERLGSVLTRPRQDTLIIDETYHLGLVRQVDVVRTRPPMISPLGPSYGVFTLTLEAASHLRFGVDPQAATLTGAGSDLENLGDMDAPVIARLTGPLVSPGVSWPGGGWQYRGSVPSGTTLIVDMQRRTVRNPATSARSRQHAGGDWLTLPPGKTRVARTGTGNGTVSVEWRSAWA